MKTTKTETKKVTEEVIKKTLAHPKHGKLPSDLLFGNNRML